MGLRMEIYSITQLGKNLQRNPEVFTMIDKAKVRLAAAFVLGALCAVLVLTFFQQQKKEKAFLQEAHMYLLEMEWKLSHMIQPDYAPSVRQMLIDTLLVEQQIILFEQLMIYGSRNMSGKNIFPDSYRGFGLVESYLTDCIIDCPDLPLYDKRGALSENQQAFLVRLAWHVQIMRRSISHENMSGMVYDGAGLDKFISQYNSFQQIWQLEYGHGISELSPFALVQPQ